jgi:hypothetical protein
MNLPLPILAIVALAGLGLAAIVFLRRSTAPGRIIHVIERASIGSRRSLVVVQVGGRALLLAVSEAGMSLLDARAVSPVFPATAEVSPVPVPATATVRTDNRDAAAIGSQGFDALDLRFFEDGESDVAMAALAGSFDVDFASPD